MKHIRVFALMLAVLLAIAPICGVSLAEAGESSSSDTHTEQTQDDLGQSPSPVAEGATKAPPPTQAPTPTQVPTPAQEVATQAPTPTQEVATQEPTPTQAASATPVPTMESTQNPTPTVGAQPSIVFNPDGVVMDASRLRQGGYLIVALPIGYQTGEGSVYWSNQTASGRWTPTAEPHPGYFSQDIAGYLAAAKWEIKGSGFDLDAIFDMSEGDTRNIIARAAEGNNYGLAEGTPFNAGYAVFYLPIRESAPNGTYRLVFEFDMPDGVANSERLEYVFNIALKNAAATAAPTPDATVPSGTVAPTKQPGGDEPSGDVPGGDEPGGDVPGGDEPGGDVPGGDEPGGDVPGGDEPDDDYYTGSGTIMIGESEVQTVKVKQTGVKLAVPISYVIENARIYSNHSPEGKVVEAGQSSDAYSQKILNYIDWLEVSVSPETAASDAFPFQLSEQGVGKAVIAGGRNYGYAIFDNLTVKRNLSNGSMAVPLTVRWIERGSDEIYTTEISTLVNVTGASTGGGGGGSYSAPTTPPQARVLVESLKTDPENVKAGDSFDLVMTLRNTSADQYVQNMRLTITSEEDTLIPLSGSNTFYISRIDKDSTYELRCPVRANMQVPDHPVKVDVAIEYEDSKVAAQTASQSLVVDVEQNRRVKVDEPVLDSMSPMAGDSVTASLQVINEGRTTLYNVTVTAQCDNEDMILPVSSYLGNMEGGTSKKAELDLIPTMAGDYNLTLQISYEDAMGEPFSESRSLSFYTMEEESYDSYYPMDDYYTDDMYGDESGDELTAETIMQILPFWIYALGGGILVAVVMLMGLSARNRHRKALEDDEMD